MIVLYNLLDQKKAIHAFKGITKFFKDNPKRRICRTEFFTVRKAHIKEDILSYSLPKIKL